MAATVGRIRRFSTEEINSKLQIEAEYRVAYYANHRDEIGPRLRELDEEWDIERAIELEAAGTVLTGFLLGATVSRKWFFLSVVASAMLLLHNMRGNYPLLPLFRRLGFRTAREIAQERYALKALRGDFRSVKRSDGKDASEDAFKAAHPVEGPEVPTITEA